MKTPKLITISAFYKNDKPEGLGLLKTDKDVDLDNAFDVFVKSYDKAWAAADEAEQKDLIIHYFEQLDEFALMKNDLTQGDGWMAIANIWFLEKHSYLKPDEFNGCQFFYDKCKRPAGPPVLFGFTVLFA